VVTGSRFLNIMAVCDPNEVLAAGECLACLTDHQLLVFIAVTRCQTLQVLDPMATCDPNETLAENPCMACLTDSQLLRFIAQKDCDIESEIGGGVGGGQQVYVNSGDPNGVITHNATTPAYCLDTLNNVAWWKTDGIASDTGWY